MALDFQKSVYTNYTSRPDTRLTRTSYGNMNRWRRHPELFGHLTRCDVVEEVDERELRALLLSQMRQRVAVSQGRLDQDAVKQKYPTWGRVSAPHQQAFVSSSHGNDAGNVVPYIPTPGYPRSQHGVPTLPRLGKQANSNSTSVTMPHDPANPVHLGYYKSGGYDDAHKASVKLMQRGVFPAATDAPRLLRAGKMGASWRNTKEVMQAMGKRHMFIDGVVTQDDISRLKNILTAAEIVPTSTDYGKGVNVSVGEDLQKKQQFTSMTVFHDPVSQKGTEKNNWCIMR